MRIKFSDAGVSEANVVCKVGGALAKRVKVRVRDRRICLFSSDNTYEFIRSGLKLLDEIGVGYEIVSRWKRALTVPATRYEILLPLKYNDGGSVEPQKLLQTKQGVVQKFGALTVDP